MIQNAFIGRTVAPADRDLCTALGAAKPVWDQLLSEVAHTCGADLHEWKSYNAKWGWSLRVCRKKRTIIWLAPGSGEFEVVFIMGEKAMAAARAEKLPQRIVAALESAPKYPEGTGVRLTVTSARDLPALNKLAAIKAAN